MAKRGSDAIAVICPVDGYAAKGYDGMPCPDCGTPMIPDVDVVDDERPLAGTSQEEPFDDPAALAKLDDDGAELLDGRESLEDLARREYDDAEQDFYETA